MKTQLKPDKFTKGVLEDTTQDVLKAMLDQAARASKLPTRPQPRPAVSAPGLQEQPVSNEQAFMTQSLVQELNGIYEPHAWATHWQSNQDEKLRMQISEQVDRVKARNNKPETGGARRNWTDGHPVPRRRYTATASRRRGPAVSAVVLARRRLA